MRYVALTIVLVATLVGQSFAESITVLNPSFEDGVTDYSAPPNNWGPAGVVFKSPATTGLTTGTTGDYVGQINTGNGTAVYGSQTLAQTFVANTTYTLTAAIGVRSDHVGQVWCPDSLDWSMQINAAGIATLKEVSGTIASDAAHTGFLTDYTIQYVATAADAGHAIQISFGASTVGKTSGDGSLYGNLSVDNVRLYGTAIPEPTSRYLLTMGVLGLLTYVWQTRR